MVDDLTARVVGVLEVFRVALQEDKLDYTVRCAYERYMAENIKLALDDKLPVNQYYVWFGKYLLKKNSVMHNNYL